MKIKYSPQRSDRIIHYEYEGEKITAIFEGKTDTFDFTGMPDGRMENAETDLTINPVISAERKDGVLYVKLLKFHGPHPTEEEKFPKWREV